MITNLVEECDILFRAHADITKAQWQEAYMKNNVSFLGIPKPMRSRLEKEIFKKYTIATQEELVQIIMLLWDKPEREFQYAACTLAYCFRNKATQELLATFEYMIRTKSWWDTVDTIAANLVGPLVYNYPELFQTLDQWIKSDNLWLRRAALLCQLRWKQATNEKKLFEYCYTTMQEKDFFIRKALGWALREYSKTKPYSVAHFISIYHGSLSKLTIKEASKYL